MNCGPAGIFTTIQLLTDAQVLCSEISLHENNELP